MMHGTTNMKFSGAQSEWQSIHLGLLNRVLNILASDTVPILMLYS